MAQSGLRGDSATKAAEAKVISAASRPEFGPSRQKIAIRRHQANGQRNQGLFQPRQPGRLAGPAHRPRGGEGQQRRWPQNSERRGEQAREPRQPPAEQAENDDVGARRGLGDGEGFGELGAGQPMQFADDLALRFGERRRGAADRQQGNARETQENLGDQIVLHRRARAKAKLVGTRTARISGSGMRSAAEPAKAAPATSATTGSNGIFTIIFTAVPMARPAAAAVAP